MVLSRASQSGTSQSAMVTSLLCGPRARTRAASASTSRVGGLCADPGFGKFTGIAQRQVSQAWDVPGLA